MFPLRGLDLSVLESNSTRTNSTSNSPEHADEHRRATTHDLKVDVEAAEASKSRYQGSIDQQVPEFDVRTTMHVNLLRDSRDTVTTPIPTPTPNRRTDGTDVNSSFHQVQQQQTRQQQTITEPLMYDLQGLVCHSGSLTQGHYISYIHRKWQDDIGCRHSQWMR